MTENPHEVGRAHVKDTFELSNRGAVLIFEQQHQGSIPRDGMVCCCERCFDFCGPEIADTLSAGPYYGIVVADRAVIRYAKPGVEVTFYEKQNAQNMVAKSVYRNAESDETKLENCERSKG